MTKSPDSSCGIYRSGTKRFGIFLKYGHLISVNISMSSAVSFAKLDFLGMKIPSSENSKN